jgi:hypothetical protein
VQLDGVSARLNWLQVMKPRRRQQGVDKDDKEQDERGQSKTFSKNDGRSASASDFGTEDYYRKSNAKTSVILAALELGYNVLIVDADVMMFKDPFPFFNCTTCDAHYQMDREMYNRSNDFFFLQRIATILQQDPWAFLCTPSISFKKNTADCKILLLTVHFTRTGINSVAH